MSQSAWLTSMNRPSRATIAMPWAAVSKALRNRSGASGCSRGAPGISLLLCLSDLGKGGPLPLRAAHRQVADRIVDQLAIVLRCLLPESASGDDLVDKELRLIVRKLHAAFIQLAHDVVEEVVGERHSVGLGDL